MAKVSTAFKVINERNCPFYEVNDRFLLNNKSLRVPDGQPSCLILVREFTNILFSMAPGTEAENPAVRSDVFSCGGCTGLIKFRMDEVPENPEVTVLAAETDTVAESGETAVDKQKKGSVIVSGTLDEISPSELLQFFHMHQKTGRLILSVPGGTARVAFREGTIIGARFDKMQGRDAIFRILSESRGRFSFAAGIPESLMEIDDIGDFMMILMEGLKRLDESGGKR